MLEEEDNCECMSAGSSKTSSSLAVSPPQRWSYASFEVLMAICQFTGFVHVVLTGFIMNTTSGGLQWKTSNTFHGLFMSYGMVYFQGEALLSYRFYRNEVKLLSKLTHVFLHCIAIGLFTAGFVEMVEYKNAHNYKHFYSFHSWLGLAIMFVYLVQFFFGFLAYALPILPLETKQGFMPYHRTVGSVLFCVAIIQVIIGNITYLNGLTSKSLSCYSTLSCDNHMDLLINFNMVAIVLYGIAVMVLITKKNWRRRKTPDEQD